MNERQLEAHKRMLETLPVTTHRSVDDEIPCRYLGQGYKHGKHSKKAKPVIVRGVRYESMIAAARANRVSRQLVYQWLMKGKDCFYVE